MCTSDKVWVIQQSEKEGTEKGSRGINWSCMVSVFQGVTGNAGEPKGQRIYSDFLGLL